MFHFRNIDTVCLAMLLILPLLSGMAAGQDGIAQMLVPAFSSPVHVPDGNTLFHAQVVDFHARRIGTDVLLEWRTVREIGNHEFEVQRASSSSRGWRRVGSIPGGADGQMPRDYRYNDKRVPDEDLRYMLRITGYDGSIQYSHIVSAPSQGILRSFDIETETSRAMARIIIDLMRKDVISLQVTDESGLLIDRILARRQLPVGRHSFSMDCSALSDGMYELKLETSEGNYTKRYHYRR
ncbi:MAG: hypothetical protein KFH87_14445 [Bacteroidetes bacterium]|nr:hypothetical protein [Bacteroidota bacterium]